MAWEITEVTDVSSGCALVVSTCMEGSATVADVSLTCAFMFWPYWQPGISPLLSNLRTQMSDNSVPKDSVNPATMYPFEVCWIE